jgi:hypothetical protein
VPDAHAIFARCFTCSKHTKAVAAVSQALTRKGTPVHMEIADRCPVHRSLHSEITVVTAQTSPADGMNEWRRKITP